MSYISSDAVSSNQWYSLYPAFDPSRVVGWKVNGTTGNISVSLVPSTVPIGQNALWQFAGTSLKYGGTFMIRPMIVPGPTSNFSGLNYCLGDGPILYDFTRLFVQPCDTTETSWTLGLVNNTQAGISSSYNSLMLLGSDPIGWIIGTNMLRILGSLNDESLSLQGFKVVAQGSINNQSWSTFPSGVGSTIAGSSIPGHLEATGSVTSVSMTSASSSSITGTASVNPSSKSGTTSAATATKTSAATNKRGSTSICINSLVVGLLVILILNTVAS